MVKISILDGYVDEPTCLGVPPYISPYPRYLAGAIWDVDASTQISYMTIDQLRTDNSFLDNLSKSDMVIVVAGMIVPGRYLSGFPASPNELVSFLSKITKPTKILCGPAARYGFGLSGGKRTRETSVVEDVFDLIATGDGEVVIAKLLKSNIKQVDTEEYRKNATSIREFAIKGSKIVTQHPFFPNYLITEIETYRGCPRSIVGGCSFCSEPSKGPPDFRPIKDIIDEIQALYKSGVQHIRLGNQPCLFSYMAKDAGKKEFPQPNPEAIKQLFKGICTVAPDLKTLHIDNANPGVLARYPVECRRIAKTIVKYHTPGDVAAFGVESVDPIVIQKNNLKATAEEVLDAVKLLNDIGANRGRNGMPELLPGLNFVFGLEGETRNTFTLDYEFLQSILDQKLLLRRINLRQIIPIPGTKMEKMGAKLVTKHKKDFKRFKRKVREQIERPMLKSLLPKHTVIKNVFSETYEGKLTFGRQLGSYPLLVGIPGVHPLHEFFDVKVIDHGYRSITAVPFPIDINTAPRETIEALPGVGRKRAIRILAHRPFASKDELISALDDLEIAKDITSYISLKK